jgi:hypothetical protein
MRAEEYQIRELLKALSEDDVEMVRAAIAKGLGVQLQMTPEELPGLSLEVFIPLRDMLRGILLTRRHGTADMSALHSSLAGRKPPSKTSFVRTAVLKAMGMTI